MDRRRSWNERAHLRDAAGFTPPVPRQVSSPALAEAIRWCWLPAWDLPPGVVSDQRSLPYPCCLLVISSDYDRLIGPTTGLSVKRLEGRGWACGVVLTPGLGQPLLAADVSTITDSYVDLAHLRTIDAAGLIAAVHDRMEPDPTNPDAIDAAVDAVESALARMVPLDGHGRLVNRIVDCVETDRTISRVDQLARRFDLSERHLQRLCARRIGLSPKWLIQRRRLHELAEALRSPIPPDLATVAAELGYADQAHLTRDFRSVTGLTPTAFLREPRSGEP